MRLHAPVHLQDLVAQSAPPVIDRAEFAGTVNERRDLARPCVGKHGVFCLGLELGALEPALAGFAKGVDRPVASALQLVGGDKVLDRHVSVTAQEGLLQVIEHLRQLAIAELRIQMDTGVEPAVEPLVC